MKRYIFNVISVILVAVLLVVFIVVFSKVKSKGFSSGPSGGNRFSADRIYSGTDDAGAY